MALAAVKYFGNNFDLMNSTEQFIELLYHNDHDSFAFINHKNENSELKQFATKEKCALLPEQLQSDCWISLNLFRSGKRTMDNCRELTGFYFDLDKHDKPQKQINAATAKSLELIYALVNKKILPMPTIITKTGRGLGVYYIFRNSLAITKNTEKQQHYYSFLYSKLADIMQHYMDKPGLLEVDRIVVNDRTRIVRLPGTYNTAADTYCTIADIGEDYFGSVLYYDMSDFKSFVVEYEKVETKAVRVSAASMPVVSFTGYKSTFLYNRITQMQKLQRNFNMDCINRRREAMCFIFYNTAKQIYPDAVTRLYDFNEGFILPLKDKEIKHVIKSVDESKADSHSGYYKIKDRWIIEKLNLTEQELKDTMIGQSQRQIEREAAKEKTRNKKNNRNEKILNLLMDNTNTYEDIAATLEVSVSTVKRIAKTNNINRYQKNTATSAPADSERLLVIKSEEIKKPTGQKQKVLFLAQSLFVVLCSSGQVLKSLWCTIFIYIQPEQPTDPGG